MSNVQAHCDDSIFVAAVPQVTVKSLAAAGKAKLLNNNITKVLPAPIAVQYIASGREYNITPTDKNVAFRGTPYASGPSAIKTENAAAPADKQKKKMGGKPMQMKVAGVSTKGRGLKAAGWKSMVWPFGN